MKLRSEAEALRRQTNELTKHLAEKPGSWVSEPPTGLRFNKHSLTGVSVVSDSNSKEYAEQLDRMAADSGRKSDARNLSAAVRKFAREHQGEFPSNFEQAAPYFYEDRPSPRTGEFEMLFQGSLLELTNVPEQAVGLFRQRQPWRTPKGKWARIYVMAGGEMQIVESADNFRSWEEEHIIPPPLSEPRSDH